MSDLKWRGFLAAVALATPLVIAGTPAASATAEPKIDISGGLTQPVFSYTDAIREHVRVQSSVDSDGDGKKDLVRVDIIRPKESGSGLKVPVIMHESPYYDNPGVGYELDHKKYDANGNVTKFPLAYDNYFVPRGYAYLAVDMIGTRLSEGCPTSYGAADVLGGKAVVDWLNGRASAYDDQGQPVKATWTTGRTGMIGHSYEGALGAAVAGTGVQGLATIVNISGYTSGYENARINGTLSWFAGLASWQANRVAADPGKCAAVSEKLLQDSDDATGNYNAYWDERNYRTGTISQARNVRASVFSVMGMQDRNVVGSQFSEWWAKLPRDVPRKAWVTQYGHIDPFWARREVWMDTLHQWFDHELMGVANDILRRPRVDVQLGPDRWITQADWPAPAARTTTLRPQQDGSLDRKPSTGAGSYLDLAQTEVAMADNPGTTHPNRLAFLTPPLKDAMRLSGTPSVSLRLKLDKPTANLGVLLVDYGTDTRINYRERGATAAEGLKFIGGEDCVGQSTADDDGCYLKAGDNTAASDFNVVTRGILDAQNHRSLSRSTPLTPGKAYQITWKMLPQDYEFKAGHRLGLVLTGANDDFNLDESGNGTGADAEPGTGAEVTIDLAGTSITLPLVNGTPLK
ncbi:Xaa-Pro dipeptidyl-peptidase [Nonomuraea rosea]|uniref:Xaa-Pro dipeptidyl-peptidase n=1 Tax=Nonomuraea rosea TaxID=638574 RepID=A0ABP6XYR1_9ACTN